MSVHTDCVYLQEINRAGHSSSSEPSISNMKLILQGMDFEQLISDIQRGHRGAAQEAVQQALSAVQRAGADFLVVTANTVGAMLEEMSEAVGVPVLDITKAVLGEAVNQGISRLGLLSTSQTAESGIYQARALEFDCIVSTPPTQIAQAIDEVIFQRLVKGILREQDAQTIIEAVSWFKDQGIEAVILGCTDMTLLMPQLKAAELPLLDSTIIHAQAAYYVATTGDLESFCVRYPA
ncbi:aspartate/glutamate racemase family protein [Arthrobacter sp. MYb227]|uniref:aspartate/glutamate racemase family protein n=1 Tax=Arthrobacter sp. MYb227 TaxID=1848601 RepID=UPI0021584848|nr:amino acid racemase [Arthrobacter sp. MYb227]